MGQEASDSNSAPAAAGEGGAGWVQGFSPLPTGARAGELVVQSVLGAGEFGITYLTEHEKRSKRYALKEYFPRMIAYRDGPTVRARAVHSTSFTWGLDRFLAEARALQKLKHPSLISVHGVIEMGGTGYVGMTYEAGRDFSIWLHEHKRVAPQDELDKVIAPLLQALDLAHASNMFHLDMGPESIIVRDNGTPVLVDFGGFRVGLRRRLGTIAGSGTDRPYAAPELYAAEGGGPVGACSDIYSLAALLYLAAAGKPPPSARERSGGNRMAPAGAAAQGRFRTDFLAAIDSGLQLEPHMRPQSISAWREQLLRTPASRIGAPKSAPQPSQAPPPMQKPTTRVAAVSVRVDADVLSAPPPQAPVPVHVDERAEPSLEPQVLMENRSFGAIFLGIAGLLGGAVAGALASVLVASILNPECGGDSCVAPDVAPFAVLGAAVGLWVGVRQAGKPQTATTTIPRNDL